MSLLLLVPTRAELALLPDAPALDCVLAGEASWRGMRVALVGLGPVDAACGAMHALARQSEPPSLSVLAGVCGSYDPEHHPLGSVVQARAFQLVGVGAGLEPELVLPEAMGLGPEVSGTLPLTSRERLDVQLEGLPAVEALTVCAASASEAEASARRARFPGAAIEEMEGFAVARAARLVGARLACLRAVSNVAGERGSWQVREAMQALAVSLHALGERYA